MVLFIAICSPQTHKNQENVEDFTQNNGQTTNRVTQNTHRRGQVARATAPRLRAGAKRRRGG
ncbi:hypothetical protein [Nocardiopsis sp. CNS-639]|uniref:hypothetical protein n=1 Tax=Nocardiopsis sp. CNS-639 TaxID=1169153 RepID=UPI0012DFDF73|nr:hypothetical protein [Nocardiopsis sp. CNS-639]